MLWRRHHPQTEASRETERREEADEAGWQCGAATGGVHGGLAPATRIAIGALERLRDWRQIRLDPRTPIIVATRNKDKLREILTLWGGFLPPLTAPGDDYGDVDEIGETYEENATIKAAALAELIGGPALADDSGIEVEALGWGPGVRSARTPSVGSSPEERNENILRAVAGKIREARFISVCAVVVPGYEPVIGRGEVQGRIADQPMGTNGFGYDPIFWYVPYKKTFGQVDAPLKHAVSHRGGAIRALQAKLVQLVK